MLAESFSAMIRSSLRCDSLKVCLSNAYATPRAGFLAQISWKIEASKSDDLNIQKCHLFIFFESGSPEAVSEPKISLRIAAKRIRVQIWTTFA